MKNVFVVALLILLSAFTFPSDNSIHRFKVKSIEGKTIDFSSFKGKKILVVNTASNVDIPLSTRHCSRFILLIKTSW